MTSSTQVRSILILLALSVACASSAAAQASCSAVGKARWTVKTSPPLQKSKPRKLTLAEFTALGIPESVSSGEKGAKNLPTRYSEALPDGLREGQLVRITGWVRFIKLSDDDCDYHIQVTPDQHDTTNMVIVEIPQPDAEHIANAALREQEKAPRDTMPVALHLKKAPGTGGNTIGAAYMTITGALFFDGTHYPNCDKRGVHMHASTCWEVHPVTSVKFAPRP